MDSSNAEPDAEEECVPEPLSTYKSRPRLIALLMGLSVVAMTAGALAAARVGAGETIWFIAGIACGVAAVAAASTVWRVSGRRLVTFDEGFTIETPRSTLTARWEHVDSFFAPPAAVTRSWLRRLVGRYEYRLVVADTTIDLGLPLGADERLGLLIDEHTRPLLHSKWASRLATGRKVPAGPIVLSSEGITMGSLRKRTIPFHDVDSVDLNRGNLEIRLHSKKETTRIPIAKIPNVRTVVDLIDQRDHWLPERERKTADPTRTRSWG